MIKIIKNFLIVCGIIALIYYFGGPKIKKWLTHKEKTITQKLETKIEKGKDKLKDKFEETKEKMEDKIKNVMEK
ncbi:hypothetical protein HY745_13590 [Candidatus Desantisbacteria bacterium]|nr:hypothetical protein [Candidatus Desantisbacteria bacterium]